MLQSCLSGRLGLLLARDRLAGALPRPRVRPRPLAANRQAPAMPGPAVALDLLQALDVLRDHPAQRPLDHVVLVHDRVDARQLIFGDVLDPGLRIHARFLQDLVGERFADVEDVGQRDPCLFVGGDFNAIDARYTLTLPLLMFGIRADHPHAPFAADDLALLTNPLNRRSHFHRRL